MPQQEHHVGLKTGVEPCTGCRCRSQVRTKMGHVKNIPFHPASGGETQKRLPPRQSARERHTRQV